MIGKLDILNGHSLEQLRLVPDNSVHCCVTSPPYYGLRVYGTNPITWPGRDPGCEHEWETVRPPGARVCDTNPGALQHEGNMGRDRIKSDLCRKCGAWRGELGAEPTPEMFVGHLVDIFREVRRCLHPSGVLWVNIGDSFASNNGGDKDGVRPKNLIGLPWMLAFALRQDGWNLRADNIWQKNGMPESVADRFTRNFEYIFQLTKSEQYYFDQEAAKEPAAEPDRERNDRIGGADGHTVRHSVGGMIGKTVMRNRRSVMKINTQPSTYEYCLNCDTLFDGPARNGIEKRKEGDATILTCPVCDCEDQWVSHFAAFPLDLPKILIQVSTSARGCCPACLAPFERVVEDNPESKDSDEMESGCVKKTLGWLPSCKCHILTEFPKLKPNATEAQKIRRNAEITAKHLEESVGLTVVPPTILDPFLGSGTTAIAALELGYNVVGCELNPHYARLAKKRCDAVTPGFMLA